MSRAPAKYVAVPSVDPLSMTINSHAGRVCSLRAAKHCCVNSSWPQHGIMMEVRLRSTLSLMADAPDALVAMDRSFSAPGERTTGNFVGSQQRTPFRRSERRLQALVHRLSLRERISEHNMRRSERPLAGAKDSKRHPFPVAPRKDFCVPFAASRLCVRCSKIRSVHNRVTSPVKPRKRLSSDQKER